MRTYISVNISAKNLTIGLLTLTVIILLSLLAGIILGRSYYPYVAPATYPLVFVKEFFDGNYEFSSYLKRELSHIFSPPKPQQLIIKLPQDIRDNLEAELQQIAKNGNKLGDNNKSYYKLTVYDEQMNALSGKFRLKGNMPGHRQRGYFPSINVKLKSSNRYYGIADFSVQNPGERQWLWESVSYKFLKIKI